MDPTRPTEQDVAFLRELETLGVREAQFSLILSGIQDHAVSMLDPDGAIVTWNATAERIKGYFLDEVRGKHFRLLFTDEDQRAGVPETELRIARETGKYQGDGQRLRKDGTLFTANVSLSALRDEHGILRGFVKVTHDVTARVRAERQLETSSEASAALTSLVDERGMLQAFTRALVRRFADFAMVDFIDENREMRHGELAHVEPAIEDMLRQKAAGNRPQLATHPIAQVMNGTGQIVEDETGLSAGAKLGVDPERELQSALTLPLLTRGRVFGALTLGSRSRKSYDESDLSLGTELARRLALALDNARLFEQARESERRLARLYESEQEARKCADRANKAKDDFLAIVSHELRTPLNAMLGWTRLLRSGALEPDKQSHALETIERNAVTQAELVEDLLDVSRIVSGKLSLEIAELDLRALVEEAIDSLGPTCAAKEIEVASALDSAPCHLHGDQKRLRQVVWNLLTNAIKFSVGGGQIRVSLKHTQDELQLTVSDGGRGIERELLPKVFDRFTQAAGVTTRAHGGLGLGLAISKHIVELHGGTIAVDSDGLGRGATFQVRLPVSSQRLTANHDNPASSRPVRAARRELEGLNVLVVDDDEDGRELLVALLEHSGAKVTSAESAATALRAIEHWTPHVLLSDIGMPGTDGYELMRRIRALAPHPSARVPAAALTGFGRTEDRRDALEAGFLMHLAKPLDPADVIAAVLKLAQYGPLR
jgi:PAS domain S-box-containing protein